MAKMTVLGNNVDKLVDCSEVILVPKSRVNSPHLPAGKTLKDIQASCAETPFPRLPTDPGTCIQCLRSRTQFHLIVSLGPQTTIAPV